MELTARPTVGSMAGKMQSKQSLTIARLRRLAPLALAIVALLVVRMYVRQVIELVRLRSWQSQLVSENPGDGRRAGDADAALALAGL